MKFFNKTKCLFGFKCKWERISPIPDLRYKCKNCGKIKVGKYDPMYGTTTFE
jgi:hypothetical protein